MVDIKKILKKIRNAKTRVLREIWQNARTF